MNFKRPDENYQATDRLARAVRASIEMNVVSYNEASIFEPDEVFQPFPKVPRWQRPITITEKIDGTNASVRVYEDGTVRAGSRTRWITPENDNFGFARWVQQHAEELRGLGVGHHFGEWWGVGIQRGYDMHERVFSLFNVARWNKDNPPPACCRVVPVLGESEFMDDFIPTEAIGALLTHGSFAAPGYHNPEGIMIYHHAARQLFKYTLDGDGHKEAKPRG